MHHAIHLQRIREIIKMVTLAVVIFIHRVLALVSNTVISKATINNSMTTLSKKHDSMGFPGGTVVGNLPVNAGDTGSSPGLGRSHMPRSN